MRKKIMKVLKKNKFAAFILSRLYEFLKSNTPEEKEAMEKAVDWTIAAKGGRGSRRRIRADITYCRYIYGTKPEEYCLFRMYELKPFARRQFLGHEDQKAYELRENNPAKEAVFKDKYQCYQTFAKYYKRDVVRIQSEQDMEQYRELAGKHDKLILKPFRGERGEGIRVIDTSKEQLRYDKKFETEPIIVEEVLTQADPLRSLHPASINTVRALTCRKDDKTHLLFTFVRIGMGESVVDNAGAGGISADIDKETGIICSVGHRETGERYVRHPDTGEIIPGTVIPRWDELLQMLEQLSREVPDVKIVGWDMALTEDGWAVVEGNNFPAMTAVQMCRCRGLRKEVEAIFDR